MNLYRKQLEDELVFLRHRRVAIRETLRRIANGARFGRDDFDMGRMARDLQNELRWSDLRWHQLHYELGLEVPGPPVKLHAPVSAARPRPAAPVRRTVSTYVTKVMRPTGR
jgi:hypothetical protein